MMLLWTLPLIAVLAAFFYCRRVEPYWLRTRTITLGNRGIRILHLTDLHWVAGDSRLSRMIERAAAWGIAQAPDVICCTGDFVSAGRSYDAEGLQSVVRQLSAHAPVFATLGNHDGGRWARTDTDPIRRLLTESGARVLENDSVVVTFRGESLRIAGTGDPWAGSFSPERAFRDAVDAPTLLLSHNPDTVEPLSAYPWELMLSGHTHGGQVVLFGWAPWTPVRNKKLRRGVCRVAGRTVLVSTGLGSMGGVRFGCRPEAVVIHF